MSQNPNQFNQSPEKGDLDLKFPGGVISGVIKSNQSGSIVPGQAVALADVAGGALQFESLAGASTPAFGFVTRNLKDTAAVAGDRVEVAFNGSVQFMEAGAAIARGAPVEFVPTDEKVITAAGVNPKIGFAMDKAAANTDIIRVYILTPAVTQPIALADLSDVVITTPADTQVLKYDTGEWVNAADAIA